MPHDIRTPMNVIMGFTNIALQHADDSAKMKECLEKIQISGGNLQELIDDVLDISRIESGEFKIVSQPVKLPELFDFYCQAIAGMAEAKNIRFSRKLHDIPRDARPARRGGRRRDRRAHRDGEAYPHHRPHSQRLP